MVWHWNRDLLDATAVRSLRNGSSFVMVRRDTQRALRGRAHGNPVSAAHDISEDAEPRRSFGHWLNARQRNREEVALRRYFLRNATSASSAVANAVNVLFTSSSSCTVE